MCHAARQGFLRFDVCASVTFVFSSKHAAHNMSVVSDARGKADEEKTYALQNESIIHARVEECRRTW